MNDAERVAQDKRILEWWRLTKNLSSRTADVPPPVVGYAYEKKQETTEGASESRRLHGQRIA